MTERRFLLDLLQLAVGQGISCMPLRGRFPLPKFLESEFAVDTSAFPTLEEWQQTHEASEKLGRDTFFRRRQGQQPCALCRS